MTAKQTKFFTIIALALLHDLPTSAQVDSVSVRRSNLMMSSLKTGKSSYAVWSKDLSTNAVTQIAIWNREVLFSVLGGKNVVIVKQMRYYDDHKRNKYVYTVSDRKNFQTLYDYTTRGGIIQAFNYNNNEISGADSVNNNSKRDFKLTINDFPFCFEMDLETLSLLPIKKIGQRLAINFYHPGGEILPRYYPVQVIGQEEIVTLNGKKIACWKIQLRYDENNFDYSWITKDSRELIKLEGHYGNTIFNKVKIGLPVL